jgi:hypothetical protein
MSEFKAKVRRAAVLGMVGLGVLAMAGEALAQMVPPQHQQQRRVQQPAQRRVTQPQQPAQRRVAPPQQQPRRVTPPPPPAVRRQAVPPPPPVMGRPYPPPPPRVGPGRYLWPALPLIILPPLVAGYVVPPPPPPPMVSSQMVVSHINSLNLRACPASNCQVLGLLQRGTPVTFLEYNNGWARVAVTVQGGGVMEGWVAYKYLAPLP